MDWANKLTHASRDVNGQRTQLGKVVHIAEHMQHTTNSSHQEWQLQQFGSKQRALLGLRRNSAQQKGQQGEQANNDHVRGRGKGEKEEVASTSTANQCAQVSSQALLEDPEMFLREFWLKARPVVITDYLTGPSATATGTGTASSGSNSSGRITDPAVLVAALSAHYNKSMGVKLSDSMDFEGVEPSE